MDEIRKRLEKTKTPEQLAAYDELKARIKRSITDAFSDGLDATMRHLDVEEADRRDFDKGFRNAMATGDATADFEEAMEEDTDG